MKAVIHVAGISTTADQEYAKRALQQSGLSDLIGDFELGFESRYNGGTVTITVSGLNGATMQLKDGVEKIILEKIGNYGRKKNLIFKPPERPSVTLADLERRVGTF